MVAAGCLPRIGDNGFFGATIPEDYGGAGLDLLAAGLVLRRALRAGTTRWHCRGRARQSLRQQYLSQRKRTAAAEIPAGSLYGLAIGALGLTEPGAGPTRWDRCAQPLDVTAITMSSTAARSSLPTAPWPMSSLSAPRPTGTKVRTAFPHSSVEKSFPGYKIAQKLTKMGYRGSQTAELVFEDCRVPVANRVGPENAGVSIVDERPRPRTRDDRLRLCLGVAERALELSVDYAQTRRQFGKSIGSVPDGTIDARGDVRAG